MLAVLNVTVTVLNAPPEIIAVDMPRLQESRPAKIVVRVRDNNTISDIRGVSVSVGGNTQIAKMLQAAMNRNSADFIATISPRESSNITITAWDDDAETKSVLSTNVKPAPTRINPTAPTLPQDPPQATVISMFVIVVLAAAVWRAMRSISESEEINTAMTLVTAICILVMMLAVLQLI